MCAITLRFRAREISISPRTVPTTADKPPSCDLAMWRRAASAATLVRPFADRVEDVRGQHQEPDQAQPSEREAARPQQGRALRTEDAREAGSHGRRARG